MPVADDPYGNAGYPEDDAIGAEWAADDEFARRHPYVDAAWGRTYNPNTADGELQNMRAFGDGLARLESGQRTFALIVVWLILLGFAATALFGLAAIFRLF